MIIEQQLDGIKYAIIGLLIGLVGAPLAAVSFFFF